MSKQPDLFSGVTEVVGRSFNFDDASDIKSMAKKTLSKNHISNQQKRVYNSLLSGPKTAWEIVRFTGIEKSSVHRCISDKGGLTEKNYVRIKYDPKSKNNKAMKMGPHNRMNAIYEAIRHR